MSQEEKKEVLLASDHAGFYQKEKTKKILIDLGYQFKDLGAFQYNPLDDYPDFISKVAYQVSLEPEKYVGIIFGGSGQGEAIVANRYPKVRAAVFYGGPEEIIKLSKEHNNANILSIGSRFVKDDDLKRIISLWLETPFSNQERHVRRIKKIDKPNFPKCFSWFRNLIK